MAKVLSRRRVTIQEVAPTLPIARVCVDVPLPHLDRLFDYLVPATLHDQAVVGCRVKVRFSGQLVDAFLVERTVHSDHSGKLAFIHKVVSAEPVLTPEIATLARAVADRYAGNMIDVLRLAIPPRHAEEEGKVWPTEQAQHAAQPKDPVAPTEVTRTTVDTSAWNQYHNGQAFGNALAKGQFPRAVWQALPGENWSARLAEILKITVDSGHGALALVPDARDISRLDSALTALLGEGQHVVLTAALGPKERYRRWLAVRRGQVRCVIGTRAAAFAPISDLGCIAIWDDGDDLYAEPRAPYPHTRDVVLVRAQLLGTGILIGGTTRTPEAQLLLDTSWAHPVQPDRTVIRSVAPRVTALADEAYARDNTAGQARLPTPAWQAARAALQNGTPVLVQVPRRGYLPAVACLNCRIPARCTHCAGPLSLASASSTPQCRWCGRLATGWHCPQCDSRQLRANIVGSARTAEELGRAFPDIPIKTSGKDSVLDTVEAGSSIVVTTPGAEPIADGGYGAALLLDPWALLSRPNLRASQEALRRWINAATLVRPAAAGGQVVIMAEATVPVVQALLRWDPAGYAARELAERAELGFPPVVRMASVAGIPNAVAEFLDQLELPDTAEVLGPVPMGQSDEQTEQALIRVARRESAVLAKALKAVASTRSARKAADAVRIVVDPQELV